MRRYSSNLSFVDKLFNINLLYLIMFGIAFMLINPIAKKGTIDPPVMMMIEMQWDGESANDVDLYVKGPDGTVTFYAFKQNGYMTLKRDDLGLNNDTFTVNGETVEVYRNYEILTFTALPDGDYVVNAHHFSNRYPQRIENVNVKVTNLAHFDIVYDGNVELAPRQQKTVITFKVKDNKVVELRDDITVNLRTGGFGP